MKKINCDIIKDVLPLYLDDVVSDATKEMVEEHLSYCDSCRREAVSLKQDIILPTSKNVQIAEARVIKNLKSRFRKKNTIIIVSSIVIAILIMIGIHSYAVLSKNYIPYDSTKIYIDEMNGKLYAAYQGGDLAGTISIDPTTITVDGEEKNISLFYYYETPWSKYIQPLISGNDESAKNEIILYLGEMEDIDQIYYGEFTLEEVPVDCTAIAEKSEMIWEK